MPSPTSTLDALIDFCFSYSLAISLLGFHSGLVPASQTLQELASKRLIILEGIDGTGKSTQVNKLAEWLKSQGYRVTTSFEPTNGTYGKQLRDSASTGRLNVEQELELFIKDRKDHIETLIQPALEKGHFVILDRYYFSTMAYQGARGLDPLTIRSENEAFAPLPALVLIMTLPVELALERIGLRDGEGNAFEKKEDLRACDVIFNTLTDPFIRRVESTGTPEHVSISIQEIVKELL